VLAFPLETERTFNGLRIQRLSAIGWRQKGRHTMKLLLAALSCLLMFALAPQAAAKPTPSRSSTTQAAAIPQRTVDAARAVVIERWSAIGLAPAEATVRLTALEDGEIFALAERLDQLQAAGGLNRWQIAAIVVGGVVVMTLWLLFLGASPL
jgi:hypothetical protein